MAWFEEAAGGRAALSVPCSAGGVCNEATGSCSCRGDMFEGDACDVLSCPTCNYQGTCRDMEYFAAVRERRPCPRPQTGIPVPSEDGWVAVVVGNQPLSARELHTFRYDKQIGRRKPDSPLSREFRDCCEGGVGK